MQREQPRRVGKGGFNARRCHAKHAPARLCARGRRNTGACAEQRARGACEAEAETETGDLHPLHDERGADQLAPKLPPSSRPRPATCSVPPAQAEELGYAQPRPRELEQHGLARLRWPPRPRDRVAEARCPAYAVEASGVRGLSALAPGHPVAHRATASTHTQLWDEHLGQALAASARSSAQFRQKTTFVVAVNRVLSPGSQLLATRGYKGWLLAA
jgi:hypothetical protein